ncbi:MAG: type II toxin-antitoxin system death-on-curing family toxin [Planctomycetes bacterium]|nr:type II toxin-antitoxin system death-on-curing family toxin [Planctomycetota bacterium]NUQ35649.1 type II toxin-antitoxin system death-on-curing family toxin [Planctomycetaceae bacterium]
MNGEYTFLTYDDVLELHGDMIRHFGGSPGLRDQGLLESALAQPMQSFGGQYVHENIFDMAAAYCFHIAKNHPFVDGNKRTAAYAALIFFGANGIQMSPDPEDFARVVNDVAAGAMSKEALTEYFRKHAAGS